MSTASYEDNVKLVWRVCGVLAVVTAVEIIAALLHYYFMVDTVPKIWLNVLFIVLSAMKAYYIMSEFMHLKYELKPLIVSVMAPFLFLIWAIIAFAYDGAAWLALRNILG